jgi:hypothetical protein
MILINRSESRESVRVFIAEAEASCNEIRYSFRDERLERAVASIDGALRFGHVVTAW